MPLATNVPQRASQLANTGTTVLLGRDRSGEWRVSDGGGQFLWGLLVSVSLNQQADSGVDAQINQSLSAMLSKRPDLPFLLSAASAALLLVIPSLRRSYKSRARQMVPNERPFGESRSSEEPLSLELQRAQEHDRGRHATQPLQIPWKGWYDILWRTYKEMNRTGCCRLPAAFHSSHC